MAFPVVATTNSGNDTTGTSHTVTLPGSIAAGDLLIVIFATDGNPTVTWPSGWDQAANNLLATTASGTANTLTCKQRIADGSEGASITVTTSASEWTAWSTLRITGWHGTTVAEAGAATGASTTANPPSLNPTGWDVEDTLWIACSSRDTGGTDDDDNTAHPASYTAIHNVLGGTNAGAVNLTTSRRDNAVSAEDPGTYTAPTSEDWVAATISIRPQGGITGTAALTVPQPAIAGSGTVTVNITGTAALAVAQPTIAASGTLTVFITGAAALDVAQPVIAASGTTQVLITGTGALTVPQPVIAGDGTIPVPEPIGGGVRVRRRAPPFQPKRPRKEPEPIYLDDPTLDPVPVAATDDDEVMELMSLGVF